MRKFLNLERKRFLNSNDDIQNILRRSSKATCGIMEREINVPKENVSETIKKLKKKGFNIIGTSHGDTRMKKIWFIRAGGF